MKHQFSAKLTMIGRACPGLAVVFGLLLFCLPLRQAAAQVQTLPAAATTPALSTPRAAYGLFTAVALAGRRLVAVGEQGRIVVSDDSGADWRQALVPVQVTLTAIAFATPELGWAVGQMGIVLRTTDGGQSWTRVLDGDTVNSLLLAAAKADVAARPGDAAASANLQAAQQLSAAGPSVPFLAVLPFSANDLTVVGGFGLAVSSIDGGLHWKSIFDEIPNPNGMNIYAMLRREDEVYLIGEQAFVARRQGETGYTLVPMPVPGTLFGGLAVGAASLLLYGLQGTIMLSVDAGASWKPVASGIAAGIDAGVVLKDGDILLGSVNGDLLFSRDGGHSFTRQSVGEPVAGLIEAPDGAVIIAGPAGLNRVAATSLFPAP